MPGKGHQHLSHFRCLPKGREEYLPPPAAWPTAGCFPQTGSGRPLGAQAWLDSSLLLRRPVSAGSASQNPQRPGPGVARPRTRLRPLPGSQARGWGRGLVLSREEKGSEGGGRIPPALLCPNSGFARGSGVKGKEGGVRARGDGVTRFGGAGGGEGCVLPPFRGPGPGGRAGRARGQAGPPTQG